MFDDGLKKKEREVEKILTSLFGYKKKFWGSCLFFEKLRKKILFRKQKEP
ncbi:hypothetical protein HMPREF1049_0981 [Fusobacterium necrophorum subsp. funduliforme ATCC 51357]|uniref:Uncharacterized protein n=1 Tax=Fusobacterium necrophorum subsp. funduliforme B35 TaxID=1226633 RepID=A0A0B4FMY7_9FUSO|nr:hypothetical protein HMPREF1049_0981 [Fusobacterium necrophorum subsp. funduliforme ATCC 51357]KID48672.1 hypothetical protein C095_08010 [Fusobacterium necrophorum subsp. funduliforme B35]